MAATIIDPQSLTVGQYVSFTCKHPTDQQTYEGRIVGITTYDIVKMIEADLIPYYREVAKVIPDLAPYNTLKYLVLQYKQSDELTNLTVVRAVEWIDPASVNILNPDAQFDIRIYNRDRAVDGQQILDLLKAHGYVCGFISE